MQKQANESTIVVIYDEYEEIQGGKGVWSSIEAVRKIGILNTEELAKNLRNLCADMSRVFDDATSINNDFQLRTIEIVVEVSAKGEVRLVGNGLGGELKGGLKLVLSRTDQQG